MRQRAPVGADVRQDRTLEAWVAARAGDPHPGPLPEGEGVNMALAEPVAHHVFGEQVGAEVEALDRALAELGLGKQNPRPSRG